jgi:hypothetical protein
MSAFGSKADMVVLLRFRAWDVWAVFAIAVGAVVLAVVFDQSPLLVFTLVALALCAYIAIRFSPITTDGRAEF